MLRVSRGNPTEFSGLQILSPPSLSEGCHMRTIISADVEPFCIMVSAGDLAYLEEKLKRPITPLEYACFENLWSEHCSYRSTKAFLKTLPTTGENVLLGPGMMPPL